MNLILMQCLTLFCTVLSFDINLPALRAFPYIEGAVGVHNLTSSHKTPLSTLTTTWYILLKKSEGDLSTIGNGCPNNSSICAITKVYPNDGEDPMITGIFSVDGNLTRISTMTKKVDPYYYGVSVSWGKQVWDDFSFFVQLDMLCLYDDFIDDSIDDTESLELRHSFSIENMEHNGILWKSKSFCNGTLDRSLYDEDSNYGDLNDGGGNDWEFFNIIALIMVLVLAGYLIFFPNLTLF